MKQLKNIIKIGLKFAITSFVCNLVAINSLPSDGTGDTNLNFPSYGTNTTMPRSDNAFDDAVNYHNSEGSSEVMGVDDDLDVSVPHNFKNPRRNSSLMIAVLQDDFAMVKNLVQDKKININYKNLDGQTALHYAATHDNRRIITLLLDCGADVNVIDKLGNSPLHCAVENNSFIAAELLMQRGANPQSKNTDDETALDYARNSRMKAILEIK